MSKAWLAAGWSVVMVVGAAIVWRSGQLSLRYNEWTTKFRERHPRINPPPTPQMRALNTKIMTWLFLIVGASVILFSVIALFSIWDAH